MQTTQTTYSDAFLNYWGDVYLRQRVAQYGISFWAFLLDPHHHMRRIDGGEYRPLLPAQIQVAARLSHDEAMAELQQAEADAQVQALEHDADVVFRDGRFIEPLHHCAHPRTRPSRRHMPSGRVHDVYANS